MDKEPATQDRPGSDVVEVARRKFGRFVTLFSSTAAVAAFLLFAGFLSEFAVYRFAGLPRLSFNFTALAESGVEVLVDTLALTVSDGARGFLLLGLFVVVLLVWSARESTRWIDRLARSPLAFYLASLMTLMLAGGLLLGQIGLARQGLLGNDPHRLSVALEAAYAKEVPSPRERMRKLERLGYEVPYLPPINWLVDLLQSKNQRIEWSEIRQGIQTRTLPESRDAARQVYGWLVLGTLVLIGLILILDRWREWLDGCLAAETDTRVVWTPRGPFGPGGSLFALLEQIRFLVAPLTLIVSAVTVALLPISHGILARPSIGSETVMVLLRADSPPGKPKDADSPPDMPKDAAVAADKPKDTAVVAAPAAASSQKAAPAPAPQDATRTPRTMALSCAFGTLDDKPIKAAITTYDHALRDLLQIRQSSETVYSKRLEAYRKAVWRWARLVAESNCADEFRAMWERRPPRGLASSSPDVPGHFRGAFSQVAEQFPRVRFGTILRYPRDSESLELIDTIKPRDALSRGQWAIDYYDRKLIDEVVVLPDTEGLRVRQALRAGEIQKLLRSDPDNDKVEGLLSNLTPDAVDATLDLIKQRTLFPTRAGVLVTYAGHMGRAIGSERPDLAGSVSDLLIDLASSKPTAFWPDKDADIRGAAATALHLSGGVYAAKLLADAIDSDKQAPTAPGNADAACGDGIQCIPQVISTAGYLLQDALSEQQELRRAGANPPLLDDTAWRLTGFLVDVVADGGRSASERGAGCSALKVAGRWSPTPADKEKAKDKEKDRFRQVQDRLSTAIEGFRDKGNDLSLGPCISAMPTLDMSAERNRRLLREIVAGGAGTAAWPLNIREAAFSALYQMSLSGESEFLFGLFADKSDWRAKLAAKFLEDTVPEPLSADLLACAEQAWQTDTPRALRCLHGLNLLDDDWDGDQDAVVRLLAIMRQAPPEPVRAKVCQVLTELQQRDSNLAGTALRATPQGSRCRDQDYFLSDNQRERWGHYVETVPGLESPDL